MRLKMFKTAILSCLLALSLIVPAQATIQWTNNASSVIADAGGISAGALSLTVTAGHGDRFPAVSAPHYFMVTLVDTSGNREIVKVTARTALSNTMTIVRAQEGTSARAFAAGSLVELRITKNALDYLSKSADIHENYYVADASAVDQGATTNTRSLKSLVDSIGGTTQATIVCPHTGAGNTTTYTVSTGFTISSNISLIVPKGSLLSVANGQTLTIQGIVQAGAYQIFTGAGTATVSTYPQDQAWWGSAQRLDVTGLSIAGAAGNLVPVGVPLPYFGATAPTGWLLVDGKTIGDGTSGGTARANADTATLFAVLWAAFDNTNLPIQDSSGSPTTRGANAAADFADHKRLPLPDMRGRMPIGLDNMGGSAASRVAAATAMGAAGGAATANLQHTHTTGDVTLTAAQSGLPLHKHLVGIPLGPEASSGTSQRSYYDKAVTSYETSETGGTPASQPHNHGPTGDGGSTTQAIMNPYLPLNWIIKY